MPFSFGMVRKIVTGQLAAPGLKGRAPFALPLNPPLIYSLYGITSWCRAFYTSYDSKRCGNVLLDTPTCYILGASGCYKLAQDTIIHRCHETLHVLHYVQVCDSQSATPLYDRC